MDCVYCGEKTRTVNSRKTAKGRQIWRRRKCTGCNTVFTTDEQTVLTLAIRVKSKNNGLKPFLREKLYSDVYDSLSHRKTAYSDAQRLTDTIISKLIPCRTGVIGRSEIKNAALEVLKRFDKAAATYYKAHHS